MAKQDVARRRKILWGVALALGLLLRLWFLWHPMPLDDDSDVYAELGNNLLRHGTYGMQTDGVIPPSLFRLPGYPLFLGVIFLVFGAGKYLAVLITQIAIDLLGCWLIARFVLEQISARAGTVAIFLAALCPFTAGYSTIALTECLSIFAVSLALWSSGRVLRALGEGRVDRKAMLTDAGAIAMAMLLRPDGALIAVAVVVAIQWYAWRQGRALLGARIVLACGLLAMLPLVPWTVRNWRTFHVFQPLAPRRVNDPSERVNYGFYRWMNTWSADIVSTGNVYWQVGSAPIDVGVLPSRAFDSPAQRAETAALLADYNVDNNMTPALDARFMALAKERERADPLLCHVWVPLLRVGDMWLRPRTETLGLDADWWRFDKHEVESTEAVGLGLVNLAVLGAALVGFVRVVKGTGRVRWAMLPVVYVVLRCGLLSTMENSEPRYTLEAFPFVLACASCAFGGRLVSTTETTRETAKA